MNLPIQGKSAIVTGAGSGIGRAIAVKLAAMGARIFVTDMNMAGAEETISLLSQEADAAHDAVLLDVTDRSSVDAAMAYVAERCGNIDILINNAGVSSMRKFEDLTEKDWDFNFDINTKGMFFCTQAALPYMREKGGRIVNTASMAAIKGLPLLAHYAASKWAVVGLTKSLALEFAPLHINVNCVCPGYVKTSMQSRELVWEAELRNMTPDEVKEEYIRLTPLGELCEPEYVADAVGFLVSPEAYFITGEAIPVTGGANLL